MSALHDEKCVRTTVSTLVSLFRWGKKNHADFPCLFRVFMETYWAENFCTHSTAVEKHDVQVVWSQPGHPQVLHWSVHHVTHLLTVIKRHRMTAILKYRQPKYSVLQECYTDLFNFTKPATPPCQMWKCVPKMELQHWIWTRWRNDAG